MDFDQEAFYLKYYLQRGGASPLYNGTRYIQYGNGFGDVLRSTSRHIRTVARKEATPTTDESDTSVEEPTTPKDDAKGSKRKDDLKNKTIIYKAPKRKRKQKKASEKNGAKFRKFNF